MLTMALISILTLAGCGLFDGGEEGVTADTILDEEIYEWAVNLKSTDKCDEIVTASIKKECKEVIESLFLIEEAVKIKEDSLCSKIGLDRYKEICFAKVESVVGKDQATEKMKESSGETLEQMQAAYDAGDVEMCDEIENDDNRYLCRFDVLTEKAVTEKDSSICEEIGSEEYILNCKEIAEELPL